MLLKESSPLTKLSAAEFQAPRSAIASLRVSSASAHGVTAMSATAAPTTQPHFLKWCIICFRSPRRLLSSTVRTLAACRYMFVFVGRQEKARRAKVRDRPAPFVSPEPIARPIKKDSFQLLMVTKPEIELRRLGFVTVGEAPLGEAWVCSTVDCAAASLPIAPTLTAAIAMAAAIPMTNCAMLLRMVASIHECDSRHTRSARAQCL